MTTLALAEADAATPLAAPAGAVRQGIKDALPFSIALIPFGLALGTAGVANGLSFAEAMFGAAALLAGAAQLAVIESIGRGEGIVAAVVITVLINLRFVYYGSGVARWFAGAPLPSRLLLAFPLVDQNFLLSEQRFAGGGDLRWRQRYYVAVTAMLAGAFLVSQAIAYRVGAALPPELGLHLAAPLVFAGMLARSLDGAPARGAAVVAALGIPLCAGWLGPATLPVAVVLGVGCGLLIARRSARGTGAQGRRTR
ncbi:AzlC family ABC transporter permease [Nocardioides sp. YIM 152588]|uniref:AzlC family ABC transporter permease n=1 Tax=Nocardioides sp. YIM 152588 TaxID=3158259 RepID=UPI0032E38563